MTKKLVLLQVAVALVCFSATAALAKGIPDTGPGCGPGKILWADYPHAKSWGPQVLISTTNNTILPWQAFGITTGSIGCTNDGKFWGEYKTTMFAEINFENLSQEMAQGHGEHLASLATLMGVPAEHQAEFFALTQKKYTTLIQAGETSPAAMIKALNAAMADHPVLAQVSTNRCATHGLPAETPGALLFRFAHDSHTTTGIMAAGVPVRHNDRRNGRWRRRRLSHRSNPAGT